jgi:hypothetical protein
LKLHVQYRSFLVGHGRRHLGSRRINHAANSAKRAQWLRGADSTQETLALFTSTLATQALTEEADPLPRPRRGTIIGEDTTTTRSPKEACLG